jgi:hypothetical protein
MIEAVADFDKIDDLDELLKSGVKYESKSHPSLSAYGSDVVGEVSTLEGFSHGLPVDSSAASGGCVSDVSGLLS